MPKKEKKNEYRLKPGGPWKRSRAQVYGEYLEKLAMANKKELKPEIIVRAARSEDSPIHECFEWDDSKAAEKYRLEQARKLVNHLEIKIEFKKGERFQKAWFSITTNGRNQRAYNHMNVVFTEKPKRDQVIQQALREIKDWQKRYESYQELAQIFDAIEQVQLNLSGGKSDREKERKAA